MGTSSQTISTHPEHGKTSQGVKEQAARDKARRRQEAEAERRRARQAEAAREQAESTGNAEPAPSPEQTPGG